MTCADVLKMKGTKRSADVTIAELTALARHVSQCDSCRRLIVEHQLTASDTPQQAAEINAAAEHAVHAVLAGDPEALSVEEMVHNADLWKQTRDELTKGDS